MFCLFCSFGSYGQIVHRTSPLLEPEVPNVQNRKTEVPKGPKTVMQVKVLSFDRDSLVVSYMQKNGNNIVYNAKDSNQVKFTVSDGKTLIMKVDCLSSSGKSLGFDHYWKEYLDSKGIKEEQIPQIIIKM